ADHRAGAGGLLPARLQGGRAAAHAGQHGGAAGRLGSVPGGDPRPRLWRRPAVSRRARRLLAGGGRGPGPVPGSRPAWPRRPAPRAGRPVRRAVPEQPVLATAHPGTPAAAPRGRNPAPPGGAGPAGRAAPRRDGHGKLGARAAAGAGRASPLAAQPQEAGVRHLRPWAGAAGRRGVAGVQRRGARRHPAARRRRRRGHGAGGAGPFRRAVARGFGRTGAEATGRAAGRVPV
ncbi:MAG: Glycosyl transferase, group 1, partial [uncultured Gemmatimonadetes bacterium]